MTREEAIKYAEDKLGKGLYRLDLGYLNRGLYQIVAREVDFMRLAIAALREQPRWISVEERLPERRGHYFIAYKFADSDMRFYGEAMWHDDVPDNGYVQGNHFANEGLHGMRVTHWMEIPQLPEPPEVEG